MKYSLCLAILCLSCGAEGGSAPSAGMVRGVLQYPGSQQGTVEVALFSAFPPRGAPVARKRYEHPTFPLSYAVGPVPEGRYFVLAIVDTNDQDGDRYHPSLDPGGAYGGYASPQSLTVQASEAREGVDIQLRDPSADSRWIRGDYR